MSAFTVKNHWQQSSPEFTYETYSRDHEITAGSGQVFHASATAMFKGDATRTNPEELLIAAVSSCHMLTFLAIAAKKRFNVVSYDDDVSGVLGKNAEGRSAVTEITLRPKVVFAGTAPDTEALHALHASSHRACTIGNSVNAHVKIEPVL